jgi:hypothetical protein
MAPKVIIADTIKAAASRSWKGRPALKKDELYLFHSGAPAGTAVHGRLEELLTTARSGCRRSTSVR